MSNGSYVLTLRAAGDEAFCSGYDLAFLPVGHPGADSNESLRAVRSSRGNR